MGQRQLVDAYMFQKAAHGLNVESQAKLNDPVQSLSAGHLPLDYISDLLGGDLLLSTAVTDACEPHPLGSLRSSGIDQQRRTGVALNDREGQQDLRLLALGLTCDVAERDALLIVRAAVLEREGMVRDYSVSRPADGAGAAGLGERALAEGALLARLAAEARLRRDAAMARAVAPGRERAASEAGRSRHHRHCARRHSWDSRGIARRRKLTSTGLD